MLLLVLCFVLLAACAGAMRPERGPKMNDVYLMDKSTGELIPAQEVIKEFYKNHGILESWADYYEETNIIVENSYINFPDFKKIF